MSILSPTVDAPSLAERIALLAEFLPESLWLVDVAGKRVIYANSAYATVWGASHEALFADRFDWLNHVHPEDALRLRATVRQKPYGGIDMRFRIVGRKGETRWLQMKSFAIGDGARPHTIGGIAFDITDAIAAEARVEQLTHFDALTGLANRNQFREQIGETLSTAQRHQRRVVLFCLGLDSFQSVNETLGYETGDKVLTILAQRLRGSLRAGDSLARLDGDQFGVLLTELDTPLDISCTARRLIDLTAVPIVIDGHEVYLGASIGIAVFPDDGRGEDQLLFGAETALHEAKRSGSNSFRFFEHAANERMRERLQIEQALRQAVQDEQFVLHYQPKVSCATGRVIGVEALVRWQHPERGLVWPAEFIPNMEESGLVVSLGTWVLRQACRQAAAWKAAGLAPLSVAVNLSARQLREGDLHGTVCRALEESGLPPRWLELELTESMLMEDVEQTISTLTAIRALGVQLSVDDFGTGYSSLSYLKRFPLDAVKVDRSFVQDITADQDDVSITRAVITMAHALRLKVVAEGVETEGQLALLIANRCDEIQGYLFSRPLPADEIAALLAAGKCLPEHLLHCDDSHRNVLLVDPDEGRRTALGTQLRRDGYRIEGAGSAAEALASIAAGAVDVILCAQSLPDMDSIDFLREAGHARHENLRLLFADDDAMSAAGRAVSEGLVHRCITRLCEGEQLRAIVAETFRRREMSDENRRLGTALQSTSRELGDANRRLEQLLQERERRIGRDETAFAVLHELLEVVPWPLLGVDEAGLVVTLNGGAEALFAHLGAGPGSALVDLLPPEAMERIGEAFGEAPVTLGGRPWRVRSQPLGRSSTSRGRAVIFIEEPNDA